MTITFSDSFLIIATLAGPILAVQAQKWIERVRGKGERKFRVFQTLMMTRAQRAGSIEHVQALNLIDLYFDGKGKDDKAVREAWAVYFDHLNQPIAGAPAEQQKAHDGKSIDLLARLLQTISKSLRYDFGEVQLKRGAYFPQAHADENLARMVIRDSLVKILSGERPIPMSVVHFPVSDEALAVQKQVQVALLKTLSGEVPIKIVPQKAES
jgi:hypothetical protein